VSASASTPTPSSPSYGLDRPAAQPPTSVSSVDPTTFEPLDVSSYVRRIRLAIEGLDGAASLHVGVRGHTVDAHLALSDPVLAEELQGRLDELRHQLGSRGVEASRLSVRVMAEMPSETSARLIAEAKGQSGVHSGTTGSDSGLHNGRESRSRQPDPDSRRGTGERRDRETEGNAQ
jgi:hypothetical protein